MDMQTEWIQMILLPGGFFVTFFGSLMLMRILIMFNTCISFVITLDDKDDSW